MPCAAPLRLAVVRLQRRLVLTVSCGRGLHSGGLRAACTRGCPACGRVMQSRAARCPAAPQIGT